MILVDQIVTHKSFGRGAVAEQNGKYLKIRFENGAEKTFVYPDAFEKFLTVENEALSAQIAEDLADVLAARRRIAERKNEENLRAMTKGIVIPGKEITQSEDGEEEGKSSESEEL